MYHEDVSLSLERAIALAISSSWLMKHDLGFSFFIVCAKCETLIRDGGGSYRRVIDSPISTVLWAQGFFFCRLHFAVKL